MAVDLVSLISQILTPPLVAGLARAAGINETVAQKLVAAAVPTILGALATTAAAPGGAKKIADAVASSDPDLLTKLAGALGGGDLSGLADGVKLLGGLLGGSGVASIAGTLGQVSGASPAAAQSAVGAVVQAAIGAIGQQDPVTWSDAPSVAALFGGQKQAIAAALPAEASKALAATGLLAGLGDLGVSARKPAAAASAAANAAPASAPGAGPTRPMTPPSRGFPTWAIILLILIVLAAVWWFMTRNHNGEPARQGLSPPLFELALSAPLEPQA